MLIEKQNPPTDMERKAKIIGRKLEKLQEKCATATEKKSISMFGIACIMEFIAEQLITDHRNLFQEHFIGHLDVFSELSELNETQQFTDSFKRITMLLCGVITNEHLPAEYLSRLFTKWLQCLERIPGKLKHDVYCEIEDGLRQNCGRFLIEANCFSIQVQMQMLDIICSYLHDAHSEGDDLIKRQHTFLKVFGSVIDNLTNDYLVKAVTDFLRAKNELPTPNEKHRLLHILCGFAKNRKMPIESLKLKSARKGEQEFRSGWMYLNTVCSTAEFMVSENGKSTSMCLRANMLHNMQIVESTEVPSLEVKFVLNFKPRSNVEQGKTTEASNTLEVIMAADCVKSDLIASLGGVFPAINLEVIQNDVNNNSEVNPEKSKTPLRCFNPSPVLNVHRSARIEDIRRFSTLPKESTFYGDDTIVEPITTENVEPSKGEAFNADVSDVKSIQNNLISSTRKRPAAVRSTRQVGKSIEANSISVYDFNEGGNDEQPVAKKSRGRGRGRQPVQPKKRAKPAKAPLPREKQASVVQSKVGANLIGNHVDRFTNVKNTQTPPKKRTPRARTNRYATVSSSGMDKLGASRLLGGQKTAGKKSKAKQATRDSYVVTDIIDLTGDDMDLDIENIDGNANEIRCGCRCRCRDKDLKSKLVQIRDSANRAIHIMDTCRCTDVDASTRHSVE